MRRPLNNVLKQGDTLTPTDTADETMHYDRLLMLGSSDDTVTFTINNGEQQLQLTLPGGVELAMLVKTITVNTTTNVNGGILVRGFAQQISLFGNFMQNA